MNRKRTLERKALTLVELLVVVTILVLLVGVVLPLMQPALRGRESREAARQISTFLAAAQARAIAEERPFGIMLIRSTADMTVVDDTQQQAYDVATVKTPPMYAGDGINAFTRRVSPAQPWRRQVFNATGMKNVLVGDTVKFGYKGPLYTITRNEVSGGGNTFLVALDVAAGTIEIAPIDPLSPPPPDVDLPFQIVRQPRKSSAAPLSLPVGAYVDITWSGFGQTARFLDDPTSPIMITFAADGSIDNIYGSIDLNGDLSNNPIGDRIHGPVRPLSSVHLLIANSKREQPEDSYAADAGSYWISIDAQTGRVTTRENLGGTDFADARANSTATVLTTGGQ